MPVMGEWMRRDIQHCHFKDYDLTFAFYSKFPSWGCQRKPNYSSAYYTFNPFLPSFFPNQKSLNNFIKNSFQNLQTEILQNNSNCSQIINSLQKFLLSSSKKYFINESIKFSFEKIFINCNVYLILIIIFHAVLLLFSWWRDKISWVLCLDFHSLLVT